MSNAGFGSVERVEGSNFMEPGIHKVVVTKLEWVTPETAKPHVAISLATPDGTTVTTQKFYFTTDKAVKISLEKLVHVFNKIVPDETINKLAWEEANWEAMCTVVGPVVINQAPIEIKLIGEEYNGNIYAKFGFQPFAQKEGESNLVFNPDTDIKREEVADMTSSIQAPMPGQGAPGVPGAAPTMPSTPAPQVPGAPVPAQAAPQVPGVPPSMPQ